MGIIAGLGAAGAAGEAGLGSILGMAGSLFSAIGGMGASDAKVQADNYNAQIAANNAALQRQNAAFAGAVGNTNAAEEQQKTRAKVAALAAEQGASGVNIGGPSSENVQASEAMTGELNAINIRSNAARQAYNYQSQAANSDLEAQLYRDEAKSESSGGGLSAATTLLGGLGQTGEGYQNYLLTSSLPAGGGSGGGLLTESY